LGMCVPFALGLSLAFPRRKVIALDSDGSLLLDTSSLVTVAQVNPANLITLVFDNSVYGRMGATATAGTADLEKIAQGAGIKNTATIRSLDEFERVVKAAMDGSELAFFVVKVERGRELVEYDHRRTHGRAMKEAFVEALRRHPDYQGKDRKSSE
jgi:sulfopyruvate decarboxylase subunit beta